jgi:hypothetical protein
MGIWTQGLLMLEPFCHLLVKFLSWLVTKLFRPVIFLPSSVPLSQTLWFSKNKPDLHTNTQSFSQSSRGLVSCPSTIWWLWEHVQNQTWYFLGGLLKRGKLFYSLFLHLPSQHAVDLVINMALKSLFHVNIRLDWCKNHHLSPADA